MCISLQAIQACLVLDARLEVAGSARVHSSSKAVLRTTRDVRLPPASGIEEGLAAQRCKPLGIVRSQ